MHDLGAISASNAGARKLPPVKAASAHWLVLAFLCLMIGARVACALDIATTDGHVYLGCKIVQVEPDALRVIHDDGAARIPYEKLPASLQKQYFDPVKVAAYRQQVEDMKHVAAAKADEDRRQRAIASAEAEERREAEEEARQREANEHKSTAQKAEDQRLEGERKKALYGKELAVVGIGLVVFLYFLPTIIGRHKTNAVAIFAFNFLLGWTFIGWVVALVWACTKDSAMDLLARERMNMPPPPPAPPTPTRLQEYEGRRLEDVRQIDDGRYLE